MAMTEQDRQAFEKWRKQCTLIESDGTVRDSSRLLEEAFLGGMAHSNAGEKNLHKIIDTLENALREYRIENKRLKDRDAQMRTLLERCAPYIEELKLLDEVYNLPTDACDGILADIQEVLANKEE